MVTKDNQQVFTRDTINPSCRESSVYFPTIRDLCHYRAQYLLRLGIAQTPINALNLVESIDGVVDFVC